MRVTNTFTDVPHEQQSPNQVGRTQFVPGKVNANPSEVSWPIDFPVWVGGVQIKHSRSFLLGDGCVGQEIARELPRETVYTTDGESGESVRQEAPFVDMNQMPTTVPSGEEVVP